MVNNASYVTTAGATAARIRSPMAILSKRVKRSSALTTSAAVYAALCELLASLETPSPVGSKKEKRLPPLEATLVAPDPERAETTALELDELWSFVLKRARKRWIWIALCRATRQVVAYFIGDRSRESCRQLWARIPAAYQRGRCFTDFWEAYSLVIPAEQHTAAGKESGLTARV